MTNSRLVQVFLRCALEECCGNKYEKTPGRPLEWIAEHLMEWQAQEYGGACKVAADGFFW
jgi:hypothetical protein